MQILCQFLFPEPGVHQGKLCPYKMTHAGKRGQATFFEKSSLSPFFKVSRIVSGFQTQELALFQCSGRFLPRSLAFPLFPPDGAARV